MINNIKDGSGQRIKELRKALNLTQIELAEKLKISNGHLSDIEKERKNLTETMIYLLKNELNINEDWVRTGDGEMFQSFKHIEDFGKAIADIFKDEDPFIRNMIIEIASLPKEEKENIKKTFEIIKKIAPIN